MTGWRTHAARLADQLRASGDMTTTAWHAAVAETPRHLLVPAVYPLEQRSRGGLIDTPVDTAANLDLVYSTDTLVTAVVRNDHGNLVPVSSSTKPDLMVRMLEALDVRAGHRVLEIGTGTGYNAALLAHHLGEENVFSIDIDPDFVDSARQRLAHIGRYPHLAVRDGATGWPDHAPYDRIICTCAVRSIPWDWHNQLAPDGMALVDFKPNGGNLVLLTKRHDRFEGRFTARYAAFMTMRRPANNEPPARTWLPELPRNRERRTTAPAEPSAVVGFLRSVMSHTDLRRRHIFDDATRQPIAVTITRADGSSSEVELISSIDGTRAVREGGPRPPWADIERAYEQWRIWGEPGWARIGVTIAPDVRSVWLDEPHAIVGSLPRPGTV